MIDSQKAKLAQLKSSYLSIGISKDGIAYSGISIPWERTAHAYNMRTPDIYISEEDLHDTELMDRLKEFHIIGCYIFTELNDYSFLEKFTELQDLHIRKGMNVTDLSFTKHMTELFMFYLEDAKLTRLHNLFESQSGGLHSNCIGLCNCEVEDISDLKDSISKHKTIISELLVVCPKGKGERMRWKEIKTLGYYYYESEV